MLRSITPPRPTSSCRRARLIALIASPCTQASPDSGADGRAGKPARPEVGTASGASRRGSVLEGVAAGGEERLLQRLGAVARLQLRGRLEAQQRSTVENPDAVCQGLGLDEVMRAEQH